MSGEVKCWKAKNSHSVFIEKFRESCVGKFCVQNFFLCEVHHEEMLNSAYLKIALLI